MASGVGARTTRRRREREREAAEATIESARDRATEQGREGTDMSDQDTASANGEAKTPTLAAIDPSEIPAQTRSGKASVVIDAFMESGNAGARVDDATKGFNVALRKYVKANELPVEVVTRKGVHYLRRTDLATAEA